MYGGGEEGLVHDGGDCRVACIYCAQGGGVRLRREPRLKRKKMMQATPSITLRTLVADVWGSSAVKPAGATPQPKKPIGRGRGERTQAVAHTEKRKCSTFGQSAKSSDGRHK